MHLVASSQAAMLAAARNRTQLHVSIALLSGAALLIWLVVHHSGGDNARPPYKVTAAFMALHQQVISIKHCVDPGVAPHMRMYRLDNITDVPGTCI